MKYLSSQLLIFFQNKNAKRNIVSLAKFFVFLICIVTMYSILFHVIMLYEGRDFSWITGLYWSLTVMSTLGFGDITFSTDLGLLFTLVVLVSGVIFLLIILPFTFIQFFYAPWLDAHLKTRVPNELPSGTKDHVIITCLEPISKKLLVSLKKLKFPYVIIIDEYQKALELHDAGYNVIVGAQDDPETYLRVKVEQAKMVVATNDDLMNTNISFTVREITENVPIITNADQDHSLDILEFAGNTHVLQFMKILGEALGRRTLGVSATTSIIGQFDELLIAETPAIRSPLEGKLLWETGLREKTGVLVVGIWEKGKFRLPTPTTMIHSTTILVLAGSAEQFEKFDSMYIYPFQNFREDAPVLILGGGRVGKAASEILEKHGMNYRVIEKRPGIVSDQKNFICGDAADINTLKKAGIEDARSVIITTHNDDMNIYLTFYCRQLRPTVQIISRSVMERNVTTLHRAGADLVMSYAAMGASSILKILQPGEVSMFTEGLSVFSSKVTPFLRGKTLLESCIREKSGCSVIGIKSEGKLVVNPDPTVPLEEHQELLLIGTIESEERFLQQV
jgi:voltage-gated potassium channel